MPITTLSPYVQYSLGLMPNPRRLHLVQVLYQLKFGRVRSHQSIRRSVASFCQLGTTRFDTARRPSKQRRQRSPEFKMDPIFWRSAPEFGCSSIGFENDTESISNQEDESGDWIEYIKRSAREADEKMLTHSITNWITNWVETEKKMK